MNARSPLFRRLGYSPYLALGLAMALAPACGGGSGAGGQGQAGAGGTAVGGHGGSAGAAAGAAGTGGSGPAGATGAGGAPGGGGTTGSGGAAGAAGAPAGVGTLLATLSNGAAALAVDASRVYLLTGSGLTTQTPGTEIRTVPVTGGSDSSLVTETGKPISIAVGGGSLVFGVEAGPYGAGNPHVYAGAVGGSAAPSFTDILPSGSADRLGAGLVIKDGTVFTGAGITVSGPEHTGILSFPLAGGAATPLALAPGNTLGLTNYPSRVVVTDANIFWIGNAPGVFQAGLTASDAAVEVLMPGFFSPTSIAAVGGTLYAEAFAPMAPRGAIVAITIATRAVSTALSATAYTSYQGDLLFDGSRLFWDALDASGNGTLLSSTPPTISEHPEVPSVNATLEALGPDGYIYFVTTNENGGEELRRVAPGSSTGAGGAGGSGGGGMAGAAGGIGGAAGDSGAAGAAGAAGPCADCTKLVACCNAAFPSSANCTSYPGQATNCSSNPSAFEGTCSQELGQFKTQFPNVSACQ
ncbi:MAG TPA: hypothetical protein VHO06_12795 [Polyangia bacterium]|nr:hypothetical protein [Polyangia bacterium]